MPFSIGKSKFFLVANSDSDSNLYSCFSLTSPVNTNNSPKMMASKNDSLPSQPSSKLANFDSELSNLISGLKINLTKETEADLMAGTSTNDLEDDEILLVEQFQMPIETSSVNVEADKSAVEPQSKTEANDNAVDKANSVEKLKALSEMYVDLNSIRPHEKHLSRCILDDSSGLKIILNFAKDRPRDDVSVYVITTTNQNRSPISNYQFDASVTRVRKECVLLEFKRF